jgi:hypothetical protein
LILRSSRSERAQKDAKRFDKKDDLTKTKNETVTSSEELKKVAEDEIKINE